MSRRIHKVTKVAVEKPALAVVIVETVCGRVFSTMGSWLDIGTRQWSRVTCRAWSSFKPLPGLA